MGAAPTSPARVQSGRPRSRRSRGLAAGRSPAEAPPGPGPGASAARPCWGTQPAVPVPQASAAPPAQHRPARAGAERRWGPNPGRSLEAGALLDQMLLQTLSPEPRLTLMATAVHPKTLLGEVTSGQAPTSHPRHLRQPQPLCSQDGCSLGAAWELKEVETVLGARGLAVCSWSHGRGAALNPLSGSWA